MSIHLEREGPGYRWFVRTAEPPFRQVNTGWEWSLDAAHEAALHYVASLKGA